MQSAPFYYTEYSISFLSLSLFLQWRIITQKWDIISRRITSVWLHNTKDVEWENPVKMTSVCGMPFPFTKTLFEAGVKEEKKWYDWFFLSSVYGLWDRFNLISFPATRSPGPFKPTISYRFLPPNWSDWLTNIHLLWLNASCSGNWELKYSPGAGIVLAHRSPYYLWKCVAETDLCVCMPGDFDGCGCGMLNEHTCI